MDGSWERVKRAAEDSRRKAVHCLMVWQRTAKTHRLPNVRQGFEIGRIKKSTMEGS